SEITKQGRFNPRCYADRAGADWIFPAIYTTYLISPNGLFVLISFFARDERPNFEQSTVVDQ
ncbi:hypothetical protein MJM43_28655, partial [Salmonella enterica subsp. enterica serovar Montevideo]|nr:hypothetical protein [Salmonella enterica subsp. enterica serovar Montevideo]